MASGGTTPRDACYEATPTWSRAQSLSGDSSSHTDLIPQFELGQLALEEQGTNMDGASGMPHSDPSAWQQDMEEVFQIPGDNKTVEPSDNGQPCSDRDIIGDDGQPAPVDYIAGALSGYPLGQEDVEHARAFDDEFADSGSHIDDLVDMHESVRADYLPWKSESSTALRRVSFATIPIGGGTVLRSSISGSRRSSVSVQGSADCCQTKDQDGVITDSGLSDASEEDAIPILNLSFGGMSEADMAKQLGSVPGSACSILTGWLVHYSYVLQQLGSSDGGLVKGCDFQGMFHGADHNRLVISNAFLHLL
ncbi:hypothetical protein EV182_004216, partial [Spiromyces aspiralis]